MGAGTAIITLGDKGALLHGKDHSDHVPAVRAGTVVETSGAGDAFNGGFAAALARGTSPLESVRFACAVARGSVLASMKAGGIMERTARSLREAEVEVGGEMAALVAFNCLGRFLETEATGLTGEVGRLLSSYPVIGFNTFGEQFHALHVNHTFTGLALGYRDHG